MINKRHAFWTCIGIFGLGNALSGCGDPAQHPVTNSQQKLYASASDTTIAQAFRPRFHFGNDYECDPLTFQELASTGNAAAVSYLKNQCNGSYNSNFAVFASVKRPTGNAAANWDDESFRVTYGVAFGWQNSSVPDWIETAIANGTDNTNTLVQAFNWYYSYLPDVATFGDVDVGTHGEDAQYATVDVINGSVNSVWVNLHKGAYTRVKSQLTMYNTDHVTLWPGKYYHSLRLFEDNTTVCKLWDEVNSTVQDVCKYACVWGELSSGNCLTSATPWVDQLMNFGDVVGNTNQGNGVLIMVEDVCDTTGTSYTSPDGVTYSGAQLTALKAYIGCSGSSTTGAWSGYFMKKTQYTNPYSLKGCDSGDPNGGDICNATAFASSDTWATFYGADRYIEPSVVGTADPDYAAGTPFNDMLSMSAAPSSITIRTGDRVDAVSVTYTTGVVKSHGGSGGTAQTLSGLDSNPVVSVYLCEGSTNNGHPQAGKIQITTLSGRTLSGGSGSSNCKTIAPAGKKLYGFFGREGTEMNVLGTYWGNRNSFETDTTAPTASGISISRDQDNENNFTGSYTFASSVGYPEVGTTFKWYRVSGGTTAAISGATSLTYTATAADSGYAIKFCVKPKTRTGTGTETCSSTVNVFAAVTWYQNANFGGTAYSRVDPLNNSCLGLSDFNDTASSMKLTGFSNSSNYPTTIWYYEDANCSGSSETLTTTPGVTASISSLGNDENWGDKISSYRFQVGPVAIFYKDGNFGGSDGTFTFNNGACNNMGSFNDLTSSFMFYARATAATTLTYYQNSNCSGNSGTLTAAAGSSASMSSISSAWNDEISSFKVTW